MRLSGFPILLALAAFAAASAISHPRQTVSAGAPLGGNITQEVFDDLEELARIVDITYCVGMLNTGIESPFKCLSFCKDFPDFELVEMWNTGMALSDSCGFVALDPGRRRIIVAFRGTYSVVNALADLSVAHQEYLPYPSEGSPEKCFGCTVHAGFMESWTNTEEIVGPVVERLVETWPEYQLTLVGHSLGGAVAALAGLDFSGRGLNPVVTTFGEPKFGNRELANFVNRVRYYFRTYPSAIGG